MTPHADLKGPGYRAMSALSSATHDLPLDPLLRELIRVRASMLNGCAYCVDMHTKDARAQGETEQRLYAVATWHEAPFFSPAERAALALTDALTLLPGNPLPDDVVAEAEARARRRRPRERDLDHHHDQRLEPRRDRRPRAGRRVRARGGGRVSAAALRALHVPGEPLILPNAWDAATARAVAAAGFPAVATTSSGVAESLGYEDGEETPADEMLAAVRRIARVVDVPVTADLEGGYGLDPADLAQRTVAAGAAGLNFEDTDHANAPRLHDIGAQAGRIAALKAAQDLVVNARIDVFLNGGPVAEGLERARAYADAGADCVYPIGITDEATIAAFVELGTPVNVVLSPAAPPIERLAELGVARISLGHFLHAEMLAALDERLAGLSRRGTRS